MLRRFAFYDRQKDPDHYQLLGKIPSGAKGKNGLLAPQLKLYIVLVPPQGSIAGTIDEFTVQ